MVCDVHYHTFDHRSQSIRTSVVSYSISNSGKERDEEWTQATAELTSDEEAAELEEDWYNPPTKDHIRPSEVKMPTQTTAWQTIVQANNLHQVP